MPCRRSSHRQGGAHEITQRADARAAPQPSCYSEVSQRFRRLSRICRSSTTASAAQMETVCGKPDSDCATLTVPLNYADLSKGTIDLAVVRIKAADPARRVGVLVWNNGGPGNGPGSALLDDNDTLITFRTFSAELLARFDIVGFDPRGVREGISCKDGIQEVYWETNFLARSDAELDTRMDLERRSIATAATTINRSSITSTARAWCGYGAAAPRGWLDDVHVISAWPLVWHVPPGSTLRSLIPPANCAPCCSTPRSIAA